MRKAAAILFGVIIFNLILYSCMRDPYVPASQRDIDDFDKEFFIINTLAETLSVIDAETGDIYNDVLTTGIWPNHCFFHGGNIYIVNSGDNNITAYDESTFEYLDEIYLGTGSNPWSIILKDGTDTAYVPCFASGDLAVVDLASMNVGDDRIELGKGPEGGVYQDGKVYVGNTAWSYDSYDFEEGTVSVVDTDSAELLKTITVETNPQSILAFPDLDEIHVICTGTNGGDDADDGKIVIIDTLTDTVTDTLDIGGSPSATEGCVDGTTGMVYLTGVGGILSYHSVTKTIFNDSSNYLLEGTDPEGDFYAGLVVDEVARRMYVCYFSGDSIIVIDLDDHYSVIEEISGSDGPQSIYLFSE